MFAQALLNEAHSVGRTELRRFPHYDLRRQDCFVQIHTIISLCLNEGYAVLRVPVHNSHSICLSQSRVKDLLDLACSRRLLSQSCDPFYKEMSGRNENVRGGTDVYIILNA